MKRSSEPEPRPRLPGVPAENGNSASPPAQLSSSKRVSKDVSSMALDRAGLARLAPHTVPAGTQSSALANSGNGQPGELSDAEIMLRVQAGDESAFPLLVEKFRRPLIGFMNRMARNQGVAEELAQEVFLRVYRSRQTYAAEAKFSTWLYRIATNLALNHLRDTRHEKP